jgi:hypothetical protein
MSSEFPTDNNDLLKLIQSYMVYRPCGNYNSNTPWASAKKNLLAHPLIIPYYALLTLIRCL